MSSKRATDDCTASDGPPAKRANSKFSSGVINKAVLESREETRASIAASKPYHHGVLSDLIDDGLLRQARDEIYKHIAFTAKETDIYSVNQTGDLANLSRLDASEAALLEGLGRVREGLYSPEFREFVSYVTDCGPLSGSKQDLSVNLYSQGCHLLNHDDVIGTRRVSYILYLPDPDEPWDPRWGGALRLFKTVKWGEPETDPCLIIEPKWNQLAFFKVQPGHSFHDVEEVYANKKRLSISGWFHTPQPGEEGYDAVAAEAELEAAKEATRAHIQAVGNNSPLAGHAPIQKLELYSENILGNNGCLSEQDMQVLAPFVAPQVLSRLDAAQDLFLDKSQLQLRPFLAPGFWSVLSDAIEIDDLAGIPQTCAEVQSPWSVATPSHLRRYMFLNDSDRPSSETQAAHVPLSKLKEVMGSPAFARLLGALTSLTPTSHYTEIRRFRPGLDYTLATASQQSAETLEVVLSVTPGQWLADSGGYDAIIEADDSDDPAVYKSYGKEADDDGVLLSSLPVENQLSVVLREPQLLRFVKYVSKNALRSRWDAVGIYEVPEDGSDSQDE